MLLESFNRSVEKECPDEQDEEDNVGEGGGEVDDFPARLDPLGEAREHDDPREENAQTAIVIRRLLEQVFSLDKTRANH